MRIISWCSQENFFVDDTAFVLYNIIMFLFLKNHVANITKCSIYGEPFSPDDDKLCHSFTHLLRQDQMLCWGEQSGEF